MKASRPQEACWKQAERWREERQLQHWEQTRPLRRTYSASLRHSIGDPQQILLLLGIITLLVYRWM